MKRGVEWCLRMDSIWVSSFEFWWHPFPRPVFLYCNGVLPHQRCFSFSVCLVFLKVYFSSFIHVRFSCKISGFALLAFCASLEMFHYILFNMNQCRARMEINNFEQQLYFVFFWKIGTKLFRKLPLKTRSLIRL